MRFAITAVDRYLGVFEALVGAGWEPVRLFTIPIKSSLDSHHAVIAFAEQHAAAIQLSRMNERDFEELRRQDCAVLVVASYNWKTPDWRPYLKYAVNFHASPLPVGRGSYPPVGAILDGHDRWGVTCHRLTQEIDRGEILASETFALQVDECHESIDLKIQMAAKRLATQVAGRFDDLWLQAKPQIGGSYWPPWTVAHRVLDFSMPVERIMRQVRAFGLMECLARVNGVLLKVHRVVGWAEAHAIVPGIVVHVSNRSIVIAAGDGYIGLIEWDFAAAESLMDLTKYAGPSAACS